VVQAKHIHAVDGHGSECLVDFHNFDIIFGELELGKELWNSNRGANTHDARRYASDGGAAEFGHDGLAKLDGLAALHEEDGGS
jgi:hypothetical protein